MHFFVIGAFNNMDYHIVSDKTDMVDMDMDHSMVGMDKMDVG